MRPILPDYTVLRGPESGLVMVRGRAGGGGAPFNLGEMTVTRCTVRTESGLVGHAYIAGRDERRAELAALADALMQDPDRTAALRCADHRAAGEARRRRSGPNARRRRRRRRCSSSPCRRCGPDDDATST